MPKGRPTSCKVLISSNGSSHMTNSHITIPKEYTSLDFVMCSSVSWELGCCSTSGAVQAIDGGQAL